MSWRGWDRCGHYGPAQRFQVRCRDSTQGPGVPRGDNSDRESGGVRRRRSATSQRTRRAGHSAEAILPWPQPIRRKLCFVSATQGTHGQSSDAPRLQRRSPRQLSEAGGSRRHLDSDSRDNGVQEGAEIGASSEPAPQPALAQHTVAERCPDRRLGSAGICTWRLRSPAAEPLTEAAYPSRSFRRPVALAAYRKGLVRTCNTRTQRQLSGGSLRRRLSRRWKQRSR
jgi:hypothetical protein